MGFVRQTCTFPLLLFLRLSTGSASTAPICTSWRLEIAAENTEWEAHVFEIELYSGDILVSGPGLGTVTSDCGSDTAPLAFDGDPATKWQTCYGSDKVGKGITYELHDPNGVTKVRTNQISSSGNAIPKFDLLCSTGDGIYSLVWTADLGTGAGEQEAASGLSAPTPEELAAFTPSSPQAPTVPDALLQTPRIFMTSDAHSMSLGGIAGADEVCTEEAGQPAKALLVDDSGCDGRPCRRASDGTWPPVQGRVDWPLLPNTTYFNKDWSVEVGKTNCHALLSTLWEPVTGECTNQATGLDSDWSTRKGQTCQSFTSNSAADSLGVGWACSNTMKEVLSGGQVSCDAARQFLCVTTPELPAEDCPPPPDFEVLELDDYQARISGTQHVTVYQGTRVALVIADSARDTNFNPDAADEATNQAMRMVVHNLENMLGVYDQVVGMVPKYFMGDPRLDGRITQEINFLDAGGLASHGVAGVAVGPAFLKEMLDAAKSGRSLIHHIFFYENTRNYIFPEVFTAVLDYSTFESPDSWGWVNQGFINILGCLISEVIDPPVEFAYGANQDRAAFMDMMEAHFRRYVEDTTYTVENTFMQQMLPWSENESLDNLYSGLLSFLYRHCGGFEFVRGFFHALPELSSRAPSSKTNYTTAMDNFFIAASLGAEGNLYGFFKDTLRWQVSHDALQHVQQRAVPVMNITISNYLSIDAPSCPVWLLRIAAENKDWEAHVFEIELYSGDELISGSGQGTAFSDCGSNPELAFDGDAETKWVTCGDKVGKGIGYSFNDPYSITKVRTHQWSDSSNAIPKFDLLCSLDGENYDYVWTASLGNGGAGQQEAFLPWTVEVTRTSDSSSTSEPEDPEDPSTTEDPAGPSDSSSTLEPEDPEDPSTTEDPAGPSDSSSTLEPEDPEDDSTDSDVGGCGTQTWEEKGCVSFSYGNSTCHGVVLPQVKEVCSASGCKVLVGSGLEVETCARYCHAHGLHCAGAWAADGQTCGEQASLNCDHEFHATAHGICECAGYPTAFHAFEWEPSPAVLEKGTSCLEALDTYLDCSGIEDLDSETAALRKKLVELAVGKPRKCIWVPRNIIPGYRPEPCLEKK